MASIARVAATINAERDPDRALELICREAQLLFNVDSAVLWEQRGNDLVASRVVGGRASQIQGHRVSIDDPDTVACQCFRERAPILQKSLPAKASWGRYGARLDPSAAVLCVPLVHSEEILGVLGLRELERTDRFTESDQGAATLFANMAAVAMVNARLQEQMVRRAGEAATLSRIGRIVASGRDVVETSETFSRELKNLVSFDRMTISLMEAPEHFRVFLASGVDLEKDVPGKLSPLAGSALEWVVKHKRTHLVPDLELEQPFVSDGLLARVGMRSALRVPLMERGEALGSLSIFATVAGAYGPRDVELLEQVAGQIAGVFANAQMVEGQKALLSRLYSLQRVTDAALSTLDLDGLLEVLLERCVEIAGADSGMILLLDETGTQLEIRGVRWMAGEEPQDYRRQLGQGISGKVALDGKPRLIVDSDQEDPRDFEVTRRRGMHSVLAVPLKTRGKTIGVFRLDSRQVGRFGGRDLRLMEVAAERMAVAIDNARLMREAQSRASHEALIHRIAAVIGSSLDLDKVMDAAVRELRVATAASRCTIALGNPGDEYVQRRWEAHAEGVSCLLERRLPWKGNPHLQATLASREPSIIEDADGELSLEVVRPLVRELGIKSMLSAALFRGNEGIGMLSLHQCDRVRRWTGWEVELVRALAAQLAVAVENARLYGETDERLRARVRELGSLVRLGRAVGEQLSLDLVMERAVEEGVRALDADRCSISTLEAGTGLLIIRAAFDREIGAGVGVGTGLLLVERPHAQRALERLEPVVMTLDAAGVTEAERGRLLELGMGASILVPVVASDRGIGVAFFGRKAGKAAFTEEDVGLARAMVGQAAVAMENARLFQEVWAQKARTEALLASMSEGVCAADLERKITAVNPWLESMVGMRAEEMVGRACREVLRHTDEEGELLCDRECPVQVALVEGKVTEPGMVFTQTAWGERIPTRMSAAPIRDERGEVTGAVSVMRDVSREWQMDKLKSNIISVVSHEFRTPLTSIIGFSELLLTREQREEEKRNCLEHIYREGLKMEVLVNDFLDVSRLEARKVVLNLEAVEAREIAERGIAVASSRGGEHRLELEVEEGLPRVGADLQRVGQILENLLSNAMKYSPVGTVVRVRARGWESGGFGVAGEGAESRVVFTVEDEGYGIPVEQLTEIFTPFHRVEGEMARRIRGTGLGLSIVKSLVELHGGKVWVESRVGVGSRFHFTLKAISHQQSAVSQDES